MNYVLVPADKAAKMLKLLDNYIIFILLNVSFLTLVPINCSLL